MRRLRKRLPLRGAGAERLRGVTAPMASRKVSACARGASAPPPSGRHTSPSRFACHLPSRGGFEARRLRKRLPLRGAGAERLRGVTAPMASRKVSACARGASAPPPSGRHTSPSRFACPRVAAKPSRPALRSAKASGCPTAAVASSAAGGAPLRASPRGEA